MPKASKQILIVGSDVEVYNSAAEEWAKYNLNCLRVDAVEEALTELLADSFVMIVIFVEESKKPLVLTAIKVLRGITNAPIIISPTQPVDFTYKVLALEGGADDVHEVTWTVQECVAKARAMIRRYTEFNKKTNGKPTVLFDNALIMHIYQRWVVVNGIEVDLVRKEFDILNLLIRDRRRVFTYEQIFSNVWGEDYAENPKDVLWTQMRRLRKKLQFSPELPEFIRTVHGVGYSYDPGYDRN